MIVGEAPETSSSSCFRDTTAWYSRISAYWFATSFKWFILFLLLPIHVAAIVPGGEKNSWWGLVVAFGAAEAMIGPAICGYLSDRCCSRFGRRRPFIAVGAALTAIALLYLGNAESLWQMIVGYLFLQISDDIATGPYSALVPDLVPSEHRGRASGILSLLQLTAQIVAAVVGVILQKNFLAIYITIAVINIVCALIVLATVRESQRTRAPAAADGFLDLPRRGGLRRGAEAWIAPWKSADFRWVWFTRFLNAFGFYLILLYMVNYLTDQVRVFDLIVVKLPSPFMASVVLALIISLSGAAASVYAGRLADRIGRKKVIVRAGWIMFATLVPFALIPVYSIVVALAIVFGVGYGMYLSAAWALVSDVLPDPEETAKDMGIWQMSVATPQILTGFAGWLVDQANRLHKGWGYSLAFLLASFAFLFGCTLVNRVRGSK